MTAQVHRLPHAGKQQWQRSRAPVPLLRAVGQLWTAPDLGAVVAAARVMLHTLMPEATIAWRAKGADADPATALAPHTVRIDLRQSELLIAGNPRERDRGGLLQVAAELIETRVDALGQRTELSRSVEQLARSERVQHALYAIAEQASAAGADPAPMFEALHAIVGTLMYAKNFYVVLFDAVRDTIRFAYYADTMDADLPSAQQDFPLADIEHGPTWYVLHRGKPLMGSIGSMRQQVEGPFRVMGAVCEDWLGVPLLRGDDVVGCVVVQSYDTVHHYDAEDQALLVFMAQHIQSALEHRLAHAELERRVEERTQALSEANTVLQQEVRERQRGERLQTALYRIAELANTTARLDDFYSAVHQVVGELLYARNFYISLLTDDGKQLEFPYWVDERGADGHWRVRARGRSLTDYVIERGQALLADAAGIAELHANGQVQQQGTGATWWLGVPLICADRTVGVLVVQSYSTGQRYTAHDQELLTFVSYHIANALERIRAAESLRRAYAELEHRVDDRTRDLRLEIAERKRVEARLKYETLHDALTGLPNRSLFMQRLGEALAQYQEERSPGFAVLFLDLDRFKVINDSVGHMVGDTLLIRAGERIRTCLKATDVVARLGGDEFAVLLEGIPDEGRACGIADRIIHDLNEPFRLASGDLFTSASIGIALAARRYSNPDELLRDADSAMYCAKAGGRHRYAVFDDALRKQALTRLRVENGLRSGVVRREFVPYYQPIVDLDDGRVMGYEALMRWRHPRRGILLPGDFMDVADDTGTLETMDWQIFTQVCRDANALLGDGDQFVAINLSARHFRNPKLDRRLLGLLDEFRVPPAHLHVEVTEHALVENTPMVKRILKALRQAGINISLDDFGTGYSSLAYLHQYPLQTIKIDRSFVTNLDADGDAGTDAVIRAILAMAQTLSIQVIAEGVETPAQRDRLRKLGCRLAQGFLYAKARPIDSWLYDGASTGQDRFRRILRLAPDTGTPRHDDAVMTGPTDSAIVASTAGTENPRYEADRALVAAGKRSPRSGFRVAGQRRAAHGNTEAIRSLVTHE